MKKILITGASGFLGYHLLKAARGKFEVYGLAHKNHCLFDCKLSIPCDVTSYIELGNIIEDIEPDVIIHAAAVADLGFCETNPEKSFSVNVEATANIAGIASDLRVPFVFTSTDMVFDGVKGNYAEEDALNPINVYGTHKALAEERVSSLYPESLIVRLPLMIGDPAAGGNNFFKKLLGDIQSGKEVALFTDEYRSVCGAYSIAEGILSLTGKANGVLHLGGSERLSRFEMGEQAAAVLGWNRALLKQALQADVNFNYRRPKDVSLNSTKANQLGFQPKKISEEIAFMNNDGFKY